MEYIRKVNFFQANKWICEVCGYEYYDKPFEKEKIIDPCLLVLEQIEPKSIREDLPLLNYDNVILNEYVQYPNQWFLDEGIAYNVQQLFEIGFSVRDNCITIPIRDELGSLVGVKGRTVLDHELLGMSKYWYPYPVPKTKILYGLDKSYSYIKESGEVLVYEAEKSVQKSFSMGFCNAVSIGGHELSDTQIYKLERLGVKIILALDRSVSAKEVKKEADKFLIKDNLYAIIENKHKGLLGDKDAPVDKGIDTFIKLYKDDKYKIYK